MPTPPSELRTRRSFAQIGPRNCTLAVEAQHMDLLAASSWCPTSFVRRLTCLLFGNEAQGVISPFSTFQNSRFANWLDDE